MDGIRLVSPTFMLPTAGAAWYGVTGFGGIAALTYGDQQFLMTAVRIPRRRPGFGPSSQLGAKFVGPGHRRHISVHSSPDLESGVLPITPRGTETKHGTEALFGLSEPDCAWLTAER